MNTQYLAFILRLRLDDPNSQEPAGENVRGSLQQVGLQEIHYFDSLDKLQEALQQHIAWLALSSQAHVDD